MANYANIIYIKPSGDCIFVAIEKIAPVCYLIKAKQLIYLIL